MQTSYSLDFVKAIPGQLADNGFNDLVSGVAGEDLPFGVAVYRKASDGKLYVVDSDANMALMLGVVKSDTATREQALSGGGVGIASGTTCTVVRKGRVFVPFSGGTAADLANARFNTAAGANKGKASASAASANVVSAPARVDAAKFVGVDASGLAQLELNLP